MTMLDMKRGEDARAEVEALLQDEYGSVQVDVPVPAWH